MFTQQSPFKNKTTLILFVLILISASLLRFVKLDHRPMHGDEAVNAAKVHQLLQSGRFEYDPSEYHGPAFFYFSALVFKIQGKHNWQQFSESDLRAISAFFGILIVLLPLILRKILNDRFLLYAMLFLAFSPALIFYNRYYIHESFFVFWLYLSLFTFIRGVWQENKLIIFVSGLALGMAVASKETWPVFLLSVLIALVISKFLTKNPRKKTSFELPALILFLLGMILPVVSLFSSFFQDWHELRSFVQSFKFYFERGAGSSVHVHPFFQYARWLWFFNPHSMVWASELPVGILFFIGLFGLLKKDVPEQQQSVLRLIGWTALICAFMFSIIPYKTPWNVLPFWTGMLLTGAYGMYKLELRFPVAAKIVLGLIIVHLIFQDYQQNFKKDCDVRNPFVYGHPTRQVLKISEEVNGLLQQLPEAKNTYLQVIVQQNDYWPLPWYFRHLKRVGWWDHVPFEVKPAPLILCDLQLENDLIRYLYEMPPPGQRNLYLPYFPLPLALRPQTPVLQLYIRQDLKESLR